MSKQPLTFFISEIYRAHVFNKGKGIGRLTDVLIQEGTKLPEVTHLCISRPFGDPPLYIPTSRIIDFSLKKIQVDIPHLQNVEKLPDRALFLRDFVVDKKVIDVEENEVEVVYDVKLAKRGERFYVTDADLSRYGLLRRMKLAWLANFLGLKIDGQTISWLYICPLPNAIDTFKGQVQLNVLRETLSNIQPVDLADILEELDHPQRVVLFEELDPELASDTLEEIDPNVQRELVSSLKKEKVAALLNDMTPGQAADVLAILPHADTENIIQHLDKTLAQKIRPILDKQEENIQNLLTDKIIRFSPNVKVGDAEDEYRHRAKGKDVIMYLYIVNQEGKLLGIIDLKELLQADNDMTLADIMTTNVISLTRESKLREASQLFAHYGFRAIPLLDDRERIVGVITYRDVMNLQHHFIE